jgi:membrane protease YdiL (CAAX protease family)
MPPVPKSSGYLKATRHPLPCLLFLLPLLLTYEAGVVWLGESQPDVLRNGADVWLRWGLEALGLNELYWVPAAVVLLFLGWSWLRRADRPKDLLGVWSGMGIESIVFALGLWGLSLGLWPLVDGLGIELDAPAPSDQAVAQAVTFLGAGIYEELIFRLVLYSGLAWVLRRATFGVPGSGVLAAVVSAAVFSAAHHIGPRGEAFEGYVFLFRTLAGVYFALLFRCRGFGVAAGAHACYDVLAGIMVG